MNPAEPFTAALLLFSGAGAVVVAMVGVEKYQNWKMEKVYERKRLEEREKDDERLKRIIAEIVAAAFTGRAEADHLLRHDLLLKYRDALRETMMEHETRERTYVDSLRDKIAEYHATSMQAVTDARKLAVHISTEYQSIQKKISELEKEVENLRIDLAELAKKLSNG